MRWSQALSSVIEDVDPVLQRPSRLFNPSTDTERKEM